MERANWDDTLLNWEKIQGGIEKPNKLFLFYVVSVAMYCISFYYLFIKHLPSEYIIFIFIYILNAIFPFIWMKDFLSVDSVNLFAHRLVLYRNIGVAAALALQFISLFMVILKNENVRKMKLLSTHSEDEENNREKIKDLNTNDEGTEKADRLISIFFVTITTLIWGVIGVAFSENKIITHDPDFKFPPLFATIRWLLNQPYHFINNIEILWHNFMDRINMSPLVKAFCIYCVTFIVTFFGAFVRIPHFKNPREHNPMDLFNVVNMMPIFPAIFRRRLEQYRNLSVFLLSLIVSLCFAGLLFVLKSVFKSIPKSAVIGMTMVGVAIFFGCFFGKRKELFPDAESVKRLVFFLLCFIFALVGTPIALAVVQLLIELGFLGFLPYGLHWFYNKWVHETSRPSILKTLNSGGLLKGVAGLFFTVLLFAMYGLGKDKDWLDNANGKSMQMFLVTLVTMTISLFTALSTKYKVSLGLYELIKNAMQLVLVYVTPLALVALAIVQFIFSYKNYMKYKRFEKLKSEKGT